MEQLINGTPVHAEVQAEISIEAFTAQVQAAATQLQAGINSVWLLGQRAVKAAYGCSPFAHDMVLALLNNLPQDAARQTHDWLKKAGILVNRPMTGSKLYWLSAVEKELDGQMVKVVTVKKPGEDGYGLASEKAQHYVKTTPPMALERKEGKPKAVKVLEGPAKNRAREAIVAAMKRTQKKDPDAAREINEIINTVDAQQSCIYDAFGQRIKLEKVELKVLDAILGAMNEGKVNAETLLKIASGEYELAPAA
jgi:hypothetical protein